MSVKSGEFLKWEAQSGEDMHRISERFPDCDRVPRNCSLMLYAIKHAIKLATQKSAIEVSLAAKLSDGTVGGESFR